MHRDLTFKDYINAEIRTKSDEPFYRIVGKIIFDPSFNAIYLIRKTQLTKCNTLKRWYKRLLAVRYGIYIGSNTKIGIGLVMAHPSSIIIGDGVTIGENCTIYQQTTFGLKSACGGGVSNDRF